MEYVNTPDNIESSDIHVEAGGSVIKTELKSEIFDTNYVAKNEFNILFQEVENKSVNDTSSRSKIEEENETGITKQCYICKKTFKTKEGLTYIVENTFSTGLYLLLQNKSKLA